MWFRNELSSLAEVSLYVIIIIYYYIYLYIIIIYLLLLFFIIIFKYVIYIRDGNCARPQAEKKNFHATDLQSHDFKSRCVCSVRYENTEFVCVLRQV